MKNYNENSDIGYFLEVDVKYPKILFTHRKNLSFSPKRKKQKKSKSLFAVQKAKKNMLLI